MFLPRDVRLMKENSQQPKGAERIRKGDRGVGELFALMEVIRTSPAKTKTNTQLGTSYSQNYETACGYIWHFMLVEMELQRNRGV